MATTLKATQLILDALRPDQTPTQWESDRAQSNADWEDLAVRAIVLGLASQFHYHLVERGLLVPPRAAAKLAATYEAHARRNAAIYAQLKEVLSACDERGLRPIVLKGAHLAASVYPEPALRPMNDIDLLFRPSELPAVETLLELLGYVGKHKPADRGPGITKHVSTYRRTSTQTVTPNPYLSTDADRTVEPHTSLEESWFGLKTDVTPGVRERAVEIDLAGQAGRGLVREDLLLHLTVHFVFHLIMGAPSMVQLTDLLAVTSAGEIDWPVFVERSSERRAAPYALAALTLARKLLGAPVSETALAELARATPAALCHHIAQLGLGDILRRTQQKPLVSIRQRIRRGFADRAETARWAPDLRGRWNVWKTALAIGRTDTWRMLRKA